MRSMILLFLVAFTFACAEKHTIATQPSLNSIDTQSNQLDGTWTLKIEDLNHTVITTAMLEFSKSDARSCVEGSWKKIVIISSNTSDKTFFPVSEALSWELKGDALWVGRNEVCDNYLRLGGHLGNSGVHGEYVQFDIGSVKSLGYFSLIKDGK